MLFYHFDELCECQRHQFEKIRLITALCLLVFLSTADAEYIPPTYVPPADRALAAEWLGELKDVSAVPALIELCVDPDGGVRFSAVMALEKLADLRAADTLAKLGDDVGQETVKGAVIFASRRNEFMDMGGGGSTRNYPVRYVAQRALMQLSVAWPESSLVAPVNIISELHRSLPADPEDFARFDRLGMGAHVDPEYLETEEYRHLEQIYFKCYQAIDMLAIAKRGVSTARALAEVLGCGDENLEMNVGRALAQRDDGSEVLSLVHQSLKRDDLSPLTLSACLTIVIKQEPAAAHALAQRLLTRMATATTHEWERGKYETFPILQEVLTGDDVAAVKALSRAQTDPARRAVADELVRRLAGGLPPEDDLMDLEDLTRLSDDQRKAAIAVFLRELNKQSIEGRSFTAAYQLGRLRAVEAVPGLLRLLEYPGWGSFAPAHDIASYYQTMAGWALTQIVDPACLPRLREIALQELHSGEDQYPTRAATLLAYGKLAGEAAIADLTAVLMQNEHNRFASVAHHMNLYEARDVRGNPDSPRLAFPDFNTCQEAAAYTLSRIDSPRARDVLVDYLSKVGGKRMLTAEIAEAIFRVAPEKLDAWSTQTLKADIPWGYNSLHETAIAVRLSFYPETASELIRTIVEDGAHPLHWAVVDFLRYKSMENASIAGALVHQLDVPFVPTPENVRTRAFELRLHLIDAIGRQGGPLAVTAMLNIVKQDKSRFKTDP